ncbi:GNAT family N-acetyltransferase [Streptomyces megasporus]|uniref:GNAT family N-acetyltransferase n=1 Tax=Streptomyces megasporus TaxID=44060 RepID=UPI00099638B5|nr:GNAT family N-acetyltransferase [Streptomyces megasporus]
MTGSGAAASGPSGPPPEAAFWPAVLVTERLVLRPVERADVAAVSRLWTDAEVRRYLGGPMSGEALRARERGCVGAVGLFVAVLGVDGPVVGSLLVEPESRREGRTEVSYQLLPEHWGRGYGREALAAVVAWALAEVTPERPEVVAVTQEANVRSRRLPEAVGMRRVGGFVEWGAPQALYSTDRGGTATARP